jgi:hypothetical protein
VTGGRTDTLHVFADSYMYSPSVVQRLFHSDWFRGTRHQLFSHDKVNGYDYFSTKEGLLLNVERALFQQYLGGDRVQLYIKTI